MTIERLETHDCRTHHVHGFLASFGALGDGFWQPVLNVYWKRVQIALLLNLFRRDKSLPQFLEVLRTRAQTRRVSMY